MKKRLLILSVIAAVLSAGLGYFFLRVDLLPYPASQEMESIDSLMKVLFCIAGVFFALIVTFFLDSLIFFRRRPGDVADGPPVKGYPRLEWAWTVIPLVIVIALSVYGGIVLVEMGKPAPLPQTELEIDVLAFRFGWQFTYPEYGIQSFDLELPVDRRVLLRIRSKDVVHSFWVPEFGPKQDAVPGMTTELRFTPTQIGKYQVQCSELCGWGHTYMTAPVYVVSAGDFQKWVQDEQKQQKK